MPEITVNEDELIGYILRKTSMNHALSFEEVRDVLDAHVEYLIKKGIAKEEDSESRHSLKDCNSYVCIDFDGIRTPVCAEVTEITPNAVTIRAALSTEQSEVITESLITRKKHHYVARWSDNETTEGNALFESIESPSMEGAGQWFYEIFIHLSN